MNDKLKIGQKKYGNVEKSARLKQLIFALGMKQTVFAGKMGVSRTTITQMLNADRDIGENIAFKIERNFPNVNTDWLMSGTGEMMKPLPVFSDRVAEPLGVYEKEVDRLKAELARERAEKMALMEVIKNLSQK